uniref:Cytochrome P450 n=1 Tax=Megaselia scalaris TaxID=36166 RepID=T1GKQ4_MEGSC
MRAMFELIRDVGEDTVKYLKESKQTELNLRDFLSRYANDVIATTAFGFQINSNKDRDNEFYKMGENVTDVDFLKFFLLMNFPKIANIFKLDLTPAKDKEYFVRQVLGSIKYRKDHDLFRPDMINLLMEIRGEGVQGQSDKKASQHWNDMEIVAQSFIFFFAAFDTVSATLSFLTQELLENQDCQDRLREEILEIADSLDGEPLSYEALGKMKYADAVIAEAMRKWPAIPFIDRVCKKT